MHHEKLDWRDDSINILWVVLSSLRVQNSSLAVNNTAIVLIHRSSWKTLHNCRVHPEYSICSNTSWPLLRWEPLDYQIPIGSMLTLQVSLARHSFVKVVPELKKQHIDESLYIIDLALPYIGK